MNDVTVCVECGIEFDPLPWADPTDPICDSCIEAELEKDGPHNWADNEPWR